MRFMIFNIVVVAALAFLVMGRPDANLALTAPGDLTIPAAAPPAAPMPGETQQVKAEPAPKPVAELAPMPPAQEVPVRVTHKAPRDVSAELKESAERIKAEIVERQSAPLVHETEPATQTAAVDTSAYDKAVSRRKALMDLASDMENLFVEKMMR